MKLSLWMIANQLSNLDLELSIKPNAPAALKSARLAYATNCVHVLQSGNDVIYNSEGDYIRIKDMNLKEGFEILQSVFDFYNDWYLSIIDSLSNLDFQNFIDICWDAFRNPIVLYNVNNKVLGISKQYDENSVDHEWKHLKTHNYSSIDIIKFFNNEYNSKNKFFLKNAQQYNVAVDKTRSNCLSGAIFSGNILCGRISIVEKDRVTNNGDIELLNMLINLMSPYLTNLYSQEKKYTINSVFFNMLNDNNINSEELQNQLNYFDWDKNDIFRVFVLSTHSKNKEITSIVYGLVSSQIDSSITLSYNDEIVVIYNENNQPYTSVLDKLILIAKNSNMNLGVSLLFKNISNLNLFYKQAIYAINTGKLLQVSSTIDVYHFYNVAIDYIIESNLSKNMLFACHPDIITLYKNNKENQEDKIEILKSYLLNERSLVNTSKELFIHRNTLVYRLKKITSMIDADLDDHYTRDYLKLSIKVFEVYYLRTQENVWF